MTKYIALLRGINVSGKNKIAMADLKKGFEELRYRDVVTYINSGNVIFSSEVSDKTGILTAITSMIKNKFGFDIPVAIIEPHELSEMLLNAPEWWGNDNKAIYDNMIFLIPPTTFKEVYDEIGEAKQEYEKISSYKNCIYWSFVRKDYSKTNWMRTASSKINDKVTIRTANTMRKVWELATK